MYRIAAEKERRFLMSCLYKMYFILLDFFVDNNRDQFIEILNFDVRYAWNLFIVQLRLFLFSFRCVCAFFQQ